MQLIRFDVVLRHDLIELNEVGRLLVKVDLFVDGPAEVLDEPGEVGEPGGLEKTLKDPRAPVHPPQVGVHDIGDPGSLDLDDHLAPVVEDRLMHLRDRG